MNSGDDELTLNIESGHEPVLLIVRSSSTKDPRQVSPTWPSSAISVCTDPVPRVPEVTTSTNDAPGSLLLIRITAVSGVPGAVGVYWIVNSTPSPGLMASGVPGVDSTVKSLEPISRWTLFMIRSVAPTL